MRILMDCCELLREYRNDAVVPALLASGGGLRKKIETYLSELEDDIVKILYSDDSFNEDAVNIIEKYTGVKHPQLREACYE